MFAWCTAALFFVIIIVSIIPEIPTLMVVMRVEIMLSGSAMVTAVPCRMAVCLLCQPPLGRR